MAAFTFNTLVNRLAITGWKITRSENGKGVIITIGAGKTEYKSIKAAAKALYLI